MDNLVRIVAPLVLLRFSSEIELNSANVSHWTMMSWPPPSMI